MKFFILEMRNFYRVKLRYQISFNTHLGLRNEIITTRADTQHFQMLYGDQPGGYRYDPFTVLNDTFQAHFQVVIVHTAPKTAPSF